MASRNDIRWLTSDQQQAWRAYIMGTELLLHQLDRELREEHDISFSEYEILVRLSEAEGGRMRMAILADAMSHSRSRVTHTIARMERADLVSREASRADGRGVEAVMTAEGRRVLTAAPPPTCAACASTWSTWPRSRTSPPSVGSSTRSATGCSRTSPRRPTSADAGLTPASAPPTVQSRVRRRCVTRCGRAASAPRRSILFSS